MPVKWDANKDSYLLTHLIPSGAVSKEKCQDIISAWPADLGEKPSVRAIQEHVTKIKNEFTAKAGVATGSKAGRKSGTGSRTTTPRKTPTTKAAGKKRSMSEDDDSEDEPSTPSPVKKEKLDGDEDIYVTPLAARRASIPRSTKSEEKMKAVRQALVNSDDSSDDDGVVEGGEYQPDI